MKKRQPRVLEISARRWRWLGWSVEVAIAITPLYAMASVLAAAGPAQAGLIIGHLAASGVCFGGVLYAGYLTQHLETPCESLPLDSWGKFLLCVPFAGVAAALFALLGIGSHPAAGSLATLTGMTTISSWLFLLMLPGLNISSIPRLSRPQVRTATPRPVRMGSRYLVR